LTLAPVAADAARTPNDSIMFYKPGRIVTGTLIRGQFQREDSFKTGTWTGAAASRDTLALYNRNTGRLLTGKFRGGLFVPKETRTIATGFDRIAAGCDTIVIGGGPTNVGIIATLTDGLLRHQQPFNVYHPQLMIASCHELEKINRDSQDGYDIANGGALEDCATYGPLFAKLAATADSYLGVKGANGSWGHATNACLGQVGSSSSFGSWDILAGTATSILFYKADGRGASGIVNNGGYTYTGSVSGLGAGWRIIVGGR